MKKDQSPLQLFRLARSLNRNELASFATFEPKERTTLSLAIARCESGLDDPSANRSDMNFLWAILERKGQPQIKKAQQEWYEQQSKQEQK